MSVVLTSTGIQFADSTTQTTAASGGTTLPSTFSFATGTITQSVNTTYQSLYLGSGGAGWYYFRNFTTGCKLLYAEGWHNDSSNSNGIINYGHADTAGLFYCSGTPRLYSLKWGSNNSIYSGGSIQWVKL